MKQKWWTVLGITLCFSLSLFAQEKYALLVGINDYKSPGVRDLKYSEIDARYLKDVLFKYVRFKERNIKVLLGRDATYANIKSEIYRLGNLTAKDDLVFFYFSGHGTRVPDTDGNEADGLDEAFCPYETEIANPATVILDDEIGHWFRRIQSEKIIVVLDCCHSGGAAGRNLQNDGSRGLEMASGTTAQRAQKSNIDLYAQDLSTRNKFIVTAADAHEQSYENPKLGHGVFTFYLGEAIRGNADLNGDHLITAAEMYEYTRAKTLAFAGTINRTQTPVRFGSLGDAVITEIGSQITDLKLFDPDLKLVFLGVGEDLVQEDDIFIIRKNMQVGGRDLEIADREIFKVQVTKVTGKHSEAEIIEEYFKVDIDPSRYGDYYAEKLMVGSVYINTVPWSTVYLDGKEMGETPIVIPNVTEGEHDLDFKIDIMGYPELVSKKITVVGNKKTRLVEKFTKR